MASIQNALSAGLLGTALLLGSPAAATELRFLCSGIGEEAATEEAAFPHSLKLVYAQQNGQYLGDIAITIGRNGQTLLETVCPGPWLLANLPEGTYTLTSRFEGKTQEGQIRIGGGAPRQVTIRF